MNYKENDTKENLTLTNINDLGCDLHTCLRKFCDTKPTSLLYNVIFLADKAWLNYLTIAFEELQGAPVKEVAQKLKEAAQQIPWGETQHNALRLAFEFMTDDDFEAMASCF